MVRGATGRRIRLSVQELPPNDWYVCVLCGEHFDPEDGRRRFCIKVYQGDDLTHIPLHTDCLTQGVGDPNVRRMLRRYSSIIRRELIRLARLRNGTKHEG